MGWVLVQTYCENGDAALGGYIFYPAVDLPCERIVYGTDKETEGFGLAVNPSQTAGAHIHLVIESVDGIPHFSGGLGGDARFTIDHPGHRFGAHAGQCCHLFHGGIFLHGGRVNSSGGRRDH